MACSWGCGWAGVGQQFRGWGRRWQWQAVSLGWPGLIPAGAEAETAVLVACWSCCGRSGGRKVGVLPPSQEQPRRNSPGMSVSGTLSVTADGLSPLHCLGTRATGVAPGRPGAGTAAGRKSPWNTAWTAPAPGGEGGARGRAEAARNGRRASALVVHVALCTRRWGNGSSNCHAGAVAARACEVGLTAP